MDTYLYNGIELPALSGWDEDAYPYVALKKAIANAAVYVSPLPFERVIETDASGKTVERIRTSGDCTVYIYYFPLDLSSDTYTSVSDFPSYASAGVYVSAGFDWTNHSIYYRGSDTLYLAASDPVPVVPKLPPSLSSRTFSFTDTAVISEITLINLDPSKTYEVYWAIYDTQDNLLGHGVSSQIGKITGVETATAFSRIVNLQPGTTYRLYWKLFEDNLLTDANSSNTVTTLGLSPGGTGDSGNSGSSGGSADSGGTGSDFTGGEDDISGSQGDGNTGILMQILNKLSAIFDFLTGDKEVEDTPEQAVKDATSDVTQAVADTIFGENSAIKPTVDTVTDVASVGTVGKSLFSSNVSIGDFLGLLGDSSLLSWFSEETAADLNTVPSVATYGFRDEFSESNRIYQRDKAILYEFAGIGGAV